MLLAQVLFVTYTLLGSGCTSDNSASRTREWRRAFLHSTNKTLKVSTKSAIGPEMAALEQSPAADTVRLGRELLGEEVILYVYSPSPVAQR